MFDNLFLYTSLIGFGFIMFIVYFDCVNLENSTFLKLRKPESTFLKQIGVCIFQATVVYTIVFTMQLYQLLVTESYIEPIHVLLPDLQEWGLAPLLAISFVIAFIQYLVGWIVTSPRRKNKAQV